MPVVYLTTPGARASLVSQRLRVEIPATAGNGTGDQPAIRDVPLHDVEHVILDARAGITAAAMAECLRRAIPLVIVEASQRVLGLCQPLTLHGRLRRQHYRRTGEPAFALAIAASLVEAKLINARRVLQRLYNDRPADTPSTHLATLQHLSSATVTATNLDTLRGYEGTGAGTYFEALAPCFPAHAPFEHRSRRPPHNLANAILSYAYTLLAAETHAAIQAAGLDPALGFLHEPEDGRPSLALDLIEPLRAPLADALALDLLSHRILKPREHEQVRDGGVYLNTEGRRRFFTAYERRMDRPFTSRQTGQRTTLRDEIRRQVTSLKKAILEGDPFEPFLMN